MKKSLPETSEDVDSPLLDVRYFMILCSDLEISVNDFWTSTPYEFNGLMRGAYQRHAREAGLFFTLFKQPAKGKPISYDEYVGFKLYRDLDYIPESEITTEDLLRDMDEDDRRAFAKQELDNVFNMFD